jgi:hypothetical protein
MTSPELDNLEHDGRLLAEPIDAAGKLREAIRALPPVEKADA